MKWNNKEKMTSGFSAMLIVSTIVLGLLCDSSFARSENDVYYEWSSVFDKVVQRIHFGYVEDVDDSLLIRNAIDGAISSLDPHTTFFDPKEYDDLMMHTEGKFGGLGIQISIRDKMLTVMTPISGTPAERAGIRSGDRILQIDSLRTKGITLDKAVSKMRGDPGTVVTLTIGREGDPEPAEYEIERAIINIKAVPYVGILDDSIGYIRLNTFSQNAGEEVGLQLDSLRLLGIKSLIFDLRFNPGGLLKQAQEVSELFLREQSLVVFTKGRLEDQSQQFFSYAKPRIPLDMPLVVLVNGASASASEIVAGAVQDWDRGVVLGDTTFGKGSVQSVFPVDQTRHMKMTTAYYYTPSGRCINRPEKASSQTNTPFDMELTETEEIEDTLDVEDTVAYYTQKGRRVYGGGGIIPDTIVEETPAPYLVQRLFLKDIFFKFANHYYPLLDSQEIVIDENFTVNAEIMADFYAFIDSMDQDYETVAEKRYRDFKVYAGFETDTTIDSLTLSYLRTRWTKEDSLSALRLTRELEELLERNRMVQLREEKTIIEQEVQNALLVRELGQDHPVVYRLGLGSDEQVKAAVEILSNKKLYEELLMVTEDDK